jgi:hypothetical protein
MRTLSALAAVSLASMSSAALAATVMLDKPRQGQTARSATMTVAVTLSEFQAGKDGWVQIWLDGKLLQTLKGTSGKLTLPPGAHLVQARLVDLDQQPLRVPTSSDTITVTVEAVDPQGN